MEKLQQQYEKYTSEDQLVWTSLFERQVNNLNDKVCKNYLSCLDAIGLNAYRIPDFKELNAKLYSSTGWQIEVVKGIVPEEEFFALLNQKKFPSSTWLRNKHQLDYLEEPDMFHDVFGHIPLLMDKKYANFFSSIATLAMRNITNKEIIEQLGRLYWFTIEFGLIMEVERPKIYGAGLISSFGESLHVFSDKVSHYPFDFNEIINKTFNNSVKQNEYFILKDWEELYTCLEGIEEKNSIATA